ncbi:tetratricopeptide repeat protein [uncultured Cardiobacterium sp.]|uniref:tetratricopeptide repeat protein n=1 Tax=uncultured Cardiobacterium sp. TaxID=417619 RepID=UPI0026053341|nr:tetratricopeptide repeat protein [uncultured Cardiobacterium sp.]
MTRYMIFLLAVLTAPLWAQDEPPVALLPVQGDTLTPEKAQEKAKAAKEAPAAATQPSPAADAAKEAEPQPDDDPAIETIKLSPPPETPPPDAKAAEADAKKPADSEKTNEQNEGDTTQPLPPTGVAVTPQPAPDAATPKPTAAEEEASPPWSGYAQAQSMAENGNPRGALKQLETRLSTHPEDSRAAYLKGLVLMQLGRGDEAERWYKMMQANFPDLPQPGNALAVIYAGRGDLPAAEAALRALLEKHPDHTSARVNLARLYVQMAQTEYEKALKEQPDNAMIARKLEALKAMQ